MEDQGAETDHLEGDLGVLLTHAAKKRAQIEKARGFTKNGTPEDTEKRIKSMKERVPCSACKAHGKTVYGHWHGDAACPYHRDHKSGDKSVLAVIEEQLSDSESDQDELFGPTGTYLATADIGEDDQAAAGSHEVWIGEMSVQGIRTTENYSLALSDTCCARTVAGEKWMRHHLKHSLEAARGRCLRDGRGRPFRFGAGPRVMSMYAVIIPINLPCATQWAHLKVSVVDQDVPLLLSNAAMKRLGVVLDLANAKVELKELCASVPLRETKTGLCGFNINFQSSGKRYECPDTELLGTECEVVLRPCGSDLEQEVMTTTTASAVFNNDGQDVTLRNWATNTVIRECGNMAKELLHKQIVRHSSSWFRKIPIGKGPSTSTDQRWTRTEQSSMDSWDVCSRKMAGDD